MLAQAVPVLFWPGSLPLLPDSVRKIPPPFSFSENKVYYKKSKLIQNLKVDYFCFLLGMGLFTLPPVRLPPLVLLATPAFGHHERKNLLS